LLVLGVQDYLEQISLLQGNLALQIVEFGVQGYLERAALVALSAFINKKTNTQITFVGWAKSFFCPASSIVNLAF